MGRVGSGVEVRPKSIRLSFTVDGAQQRHTLKVGGAPMPPTPANIKFAHRLAAEIKDKIRHGTYNAADYFQTDDTGTGLTISRQLDTWLNAQRIEASTRAGYSSALSFWKAAPCGENRLALGEMPLRSVRLSHILSALASRPLLSGKTVNNYVSVLREALQLAVADKLLLENPAALVPRAKHQKEPPDPFTRDELEAICAGAARRYTGQVANMIKFWMWTGLRTSELFGLRWPNVDLLGGTILVSEVVVRGQQKGRTKTAVARTVKLNSRARAAIETQRTHSQAAGGHVFLDPRYGEPWTEERAFRRSFWTPLLKLEGVRYRSPYNCRHTYATQMLMAGMRPPFCAKQLGHSVEIFLTTYAKWLDGEHDDLEMGRLEGALSAPILPQVRRG